MSPTARTLKWLRDRGWSAQTVEQNIPHAKFKRDLFNFLDIVCLDDKPGLLGIQVTSANGGNCAARLQKVLEAPLLVIWLRRGLRVEVHGWGMRGARGERKLWKLCYRRAVKLGPEPGQITVSILEGDGDGEVEQSTKKAGTRGVEGRQEIGQTAAGHRGRRRGCDGIIG